MKWDRIKTIKLLLLSFAITFLLQIYDHLVKYRGEFIVSDFIDEIISVKSLGLLLVVVVIVFVCLLFESDRMFKYRYYIATTIFLLCVILGVNGSSIGLVTSYFGVTDNDIFLGTSRTIRSDEWACFTPMTWSQYYGAHPFSYYSEIIRATSTDVFLEYGQPIRSFLSVFRPFQLGYVFLPIANGMAFFWAGRLIVLFMVSFELGRLITNDNRRLSLLYALMLVLAPAVQWWFAINEFVEMLVFMQLSIVMFNAYLLTNSLAKRMLYSGIITICAGGYVLSMYPAWMVPLGYVLLAFIIWTIYSNRKNYRFQKSELIPICISLVILIVSAAYVYSNSKNTIQAISSTVFPGKRFEVGGGMLVNIFNYPSNIWYPIKDEGVFANTCESAYFFTLFPMGLVLYGVYVYNSRTHDFLCRALLGVNALLGCYSFVGLPRIVAKYTLMSYSLPNRTIVIFGLTDLILLIRCLCLCEKRNVMFKVRSSLTIAGTVSILVNWIAFCINKEFYSKPMIIIQTLLLMICIFVMLFSLKNHFMRPISLGVFALIMGMAGILVNPIRIGVDSVENINALQTVRTYALQDPDAIWIVEGLGYPYNNFTIMEGARTVNCTNVYPCIERWKELDDGVDDSDIYNRYAHIMITYDESTEDDYILVQPDVINVYVNYEELQSLNVDYIFTINDFSEDSDRFRLVNQVDGFYIYEVI